jgi:hypothetical protein
MGRVAALMGEWAGALALPERDVKRWTATGWLHDVLREAEPEELRPEVPLLFRPLPGKLLHGPAAAVRLKTTWTRRCARRSASTRWARRASAGWGGRCTWRLPGAGPHLRPGVHRVAARADAGRHGRDLPRVVRLRWTHITGKGGTAHPETQALYEQVESEA